MHQAYVGDVSGLLAGWGEANPFPKKDSELCATHEVVLPWPDTKVWFRCNPSPMRGRYVTFQRRQDVAHGDFNAREITVFGD